MSGDLSGKTVLITGGNVGLGRAAAFELARKKAEVVIAGRSKESCETTVEDISALTKNDKVSFFPLDLASFQSISDFVKDFSACYSKLDILVNNAGVWSPPFDSTEDNIETTMGVNYLGHFYLTKLLGEYLIKSRARVVVLSSDTHKGGDITSDLLQLHGDTPLLLKPQENRTFKSDWLQYARSNRARIYFARELTRRHPEITSVAVNPGAVKTSLGRNLCCLKCFGLIFSPLMKTPERGSEGVMFCCTSDLSKDSGAYFSDCKPVELPEGSVDSKIQVQLWDVTDQLCDKLANQRN